MWSCTCRCAKEGKIIDEDGFELVTRRRGDNKRKAAEIFRVEGVWLVYNCTPSFCYSHISLLHRGSLCRQCICTCDSCPVAYYCLALSLGLGLSVTVFYRWYERQPQQPMWYLWFRFLLRRIRVGVYWQFFCCMGAIRTWQSGRWEGQSAHGWVRGSLVPTSRMRTT